MPRKKLTPEPCLPPSIVTFSYERVFNPDKAPNPTTNFNLVIQPPTSRLLIVTHGTSQSAEDTFRYWGVKSPNGKMPDYRSILFAIETVQLNDHSVNKLSRLTPEDIDTITRAYQALDEASTGRRVYINNEDFKVLAEASINFRNFQSLHTTDHNDLKDGIDKILMDRQVFNNYLSFYTLRQELSPFRNEGYRSGNKEK